jgi:D-serine deaminase-like pyridoxal phosphate-dependent protein
MIKLTALTSRELAAVDAALTDLEAALDVLYERGIVDERSGVHLDELADAVAVELEFREAVYQ